MNQFKNQVYLWIPVDMAEINLSYCEMCPSEHNAMCPSKHNTQTVSFEHDAMCPSEHEAGISWN